MEKLVLYHEGIWLKELAFSIMVCSLPLDCDHNPPKQELQIFPQSATPVTLQLPSKTFSNQSNHLNQFHPFLPFLHPLPLPHLLSSSEIFSAYQSASLLSHSPSTTLTFIVSFLQKSFSFFTPRLLLICTEILSTIGILFILFIGVR
jgi:hypothetical protein